MFPPAPWAVDRAVRRRVAPGCIVGACGGLSVTITEDLTGTTSGSSTIPSACLRPRYPDDDVEWFDGGAEASEAITTIDEMRSFARAQAAWARRSHTSLAHRA